jgi:GGDEF domain-containing protein
VDDDPVPDDHRPVDRPDNTGTPYGAGTICGPESIDPLTGLANHAMIAMVRDGSAIAFVDLLEFRRVNDLYGHLVGDRVLRTVAGRVRDGLTPLRLFRFGGDKFLVDLDQPLDRDGAAMLARQIGALVGQPIDGIGEPLEDRVGVTLGRVVRDATTSVDATELDAVMPVLMEAARAAWEARLADLPFVVVGASRGGGA